MTTVNITTYDPHGGIFTAASVQIDHLRHETIAGAVAHRVHDGWTQTSVNQVARVCGANFLDVISYEEMGE